MPIDDGIVLDLPGFARAVPLAAITASELGPLTAPAGSTWGERLERFAQSRTGLVAAIDTAGSMGRLLLGLVGLCGGSISNDRLIAETLSADRAELDETVARLRAAGLLSRHRDGELTLAQRVVDLWQPETISLADQHAIKSEALTFICRRLQLEPSSNKKADKIDAIAAFFGDPDRRSSVLAGLTPPARKLLERLSESDGVRPVSAEQLGLPMYGLDRVGAPEFAAFVDRLPEDPSLAALQELTRLGIVGVSDYDRTIWIWWEAWPVLDRPFYPVWPRSPNPAIVERSAPTSPSTVPTVVALFDEALRRWSDTPPPALKNNEPRLAKTVVRSTAKALGTTEQTVELISRLAISMGLVLPNLVAKSGRGRKARADYAWMVDPDALESWSSLAPLRKWVNLLGYWSRRSPTWGDQLLANRVLLLWELATLEPGSAFERAEVLADHIEHRYNPVGVDEACLEALTDLRLLGVVTEDDPTGLTELGRLAVAHFDQVEALELSGSRHAVVQADMTVIAPPDLEPDLATRLRTIATVESEAGASIHRLSEPAIASAIQGGQTAESIIAFLSELSPTPVDEVVRRFVMDGARSAEKVKIVDAPSVLVTSDPVDLATAVGMKSAKLTPITSTVAFSSLEPDKLRKILSKKNLSPGLVADTSGRPEPRSSKSTAAELERRADRYRSMAERQDNERLNAVASRLADEAADAADPSARWQRYRSFAVDPSVLQD